MTNRFRLDPASPVALYLQIAEQVRRLVTLGALKPGDRLPAVRDLAVQATVNRNTAARAIQHLESQGVVRTRVGQGTFIADGAGETGRESARRSLDGELDRLLRNAEEAGIPAREVAERLSTRIRAKEGEP